MGITTDYFMIKYPSKIYAKTCLPWFYHYSKKRSQRPRLKHQFQLLIGFICEPRLRHCNLCTCYLSDMSWTTCVKSITNEWVFSFPGRSFRYLACYWFDLVRIDLFDQGYVNYELEWNIDLWREKWLESYLKYCKSKEIIHRKIFYNVWLF